MSRRAALGLVVAALLAGCAGGSATARTIRVEMRGTRFVPDSIDAKPGEHVRFVVKNSDVVDHEFVIGDEAVHKEHREQKSMEGMQHGGTAGVAEVAPGKTVTLDYTFPSAAGSLEIACYIDDHYETGMHGTATVTS